MLTAWRLTKTKFANNSLNADGARLYGGRWNSPGVSVVYFSESISLSVLEVLVHLDGPRLLQSYSLVRLDFDDRLVITKPVDELPTTWADFPATEHAQVVGDEWVASGESLLLRLPSAIVPLEHILVLNPNHPDRRHLKVAEPVPFRFDPRLLA